MNRYIEGMRYNLPHPFRAEAERAVLMYDNTYTRDGVIRWKSNGSVPPQEILDFWKHIGKTFNMAKSVATRKKEEAEFLQAYVQAHAHRQITEEERQEMRAVYGKGATVVNVVTGQRIKL